MNTIKIRMMKVAFAMMRAIYWSDRNTPDECPALIPDESNDVCRACNHWPFCKWEIELADTLILAGSHVKTKAHGWLPGPGLREYLERISTEEVPRFSREIKFRAYDPVEKRMYIPVWVANKRHRDHILMQYTGLKDANNTEIYDGDILMGIHGYTRKATFLEVGWRRNEGCWGVHNLNGAYRGTLRELLHSQMGYSYGVVGNRYETPELLKRNAAYINQYDGYPDVPPVDTSDDRQLRDIYRSKSDVRSTR